MAPPVLYMIPGSPPVRAVLMTAKQLDIELELRRCSPLEGENLTEEFLKLNPAHTIPTLNDNGFAIWESAAIMTYLVSKYGKDDSLYPKDLKERAIIDQLLHFSNASLTKVIYVMKPILLHNQKKANIPKEHLENVFDCIGVLDKIIGTKAYVAGDKLSLADFSFVSWIATLHLAFPISADRFPNVTAWWKRIEQLPVYKVNREGLKFCATLWAERD